MKSILIPAALLFSASAFAQGAPIGCTPLGTVEGKAIVGGGLRRKPAQTKRREKRNAGPVNARAPRRTQGRRPIEPLPPAEEKTWWGL